MYHHVVQQILSVVSKGPAGQPGDLLRAELPSADHLQVAFHGPSGSPHKVIEEVTHGNGDELLERTGNEDRNEKESQEVDVSV